MIINREDDRYVAQCLEVAQCLGVAQCLEVDVSSFGDTQDEALAMITKARELRFEETPVPAIRMMNAA